MSILFALWVGAAALAAPRPPTVSPGQPALVFALPAVNENVATEIVNKVQVSLSDFAGVMPGHPKSAVVVYFYTVGQGSQELKALNRIQRRYGAKGVQVMAIAQGGGSAQEISDTIAPLKLSFPVLRDVESLVSSRYGVTRPPLTLVIEGNGNVFAIGQPRGDGMENEIEAELVPLIKR
jgi:peroxiredoxin